MAATATGSVGVSSGRTRKSQLDHVTKPAVGSSLTSTSSTLNRRQSLFGNDDRIVLDIGSSVSKVGFSGEPRPREVFSSVKRSQPTQLIVGATMPPQLEADLWDLDIGLCRDEKERKEREDLLQARLTQLLRYVFYEVLMVDPKQRKVIIVENALTPDLVKETLCRILFGNLEVPNVSFVPAPILSLLAVGRLTGLVVSSGNLETTITPVYYGRPLSHLTRSTLRSSQRLHARVRTLLLRFGKYLPPAAQLQSVPLPSAERVRSVPADLLSNELVAEIVSRTLLVSSSAPKAKSDDAAATTSSSSSSSSFKLASAFTLRQPDSKAEVLDEARLLDLRALYSSCSTAKSLSLPVPAPPSSHVVSSYNVAQHVSSQGLGRGTLVIPGWVRDYAAEVFFEPGDEDEASIPELVLDSILDLPIDLRPTMVESILCAGGTVMLPGFPNRLRSELVRTLNALEPVTERAGLSASRVGLRPSAGSQGASSTAPRTSATLGTWASLVALSPFIAILNDHSPRLRADSSALGGTAPALASNLLGWIGGSLAGALRTSALTQLGREAWDAADLAAHGAAPLSPIPDSATRPVWSGGGKGSFVGIASGIDTGAFGGLAAVSRHILQAQQRQNPLSPTKHSGSV